MSLTQLSPNDSMICSSEIIVYSDDACIGSHFYRCHYSTFQLREPIRQRVSLHVSPLMEKMLYIHYCLLNYTNIKQRYLLIHNQMH